MKIRSIVFTLTAIVLMIISNCITAFAGNWQMQDNGKWCYLENGTKLTGWYWIDGDGNGAAEAYCFDGAGDMFSNTSVDGYRVDANGAWVENGYVKRRLVRANTCFPSDIDYDNMTPEQAKARSWPNSNKGTGIEYRGKVYTATSRGTYSFGCSMYGCENPSQKGGGIYCEYHECQIEGCKNGIDYSDYNCGFCRDHMRAYRIDEFKLCELARSSVPEATTSTSSKSSSSKKSSNTSSGSSKTTSTKSYKNTTSGSSSSSKKKTSSYYDSYDDGYEDVYLNYDYDEDRYRTDWEYALGVDDAMDDEDWDW